MGGAVKDWDITKSALFTGQGLPWGPMRTGEPGVYPGTPKARDISEFAAFDQSDLIKQLTKGLRTAQSQQELAAQKRQARMGAGRSDAAARELSEIAADVENRITGIGYQAAKEGWESKLGQKQFAEQMDLQRYAQALDKWKTDRALYEAEREKRAQALGPFGSWVQ